MKCETGSEPFIDGFSDSQVLKTLILEANESILGKAKIMH